MLLEEQRKFFSKPIPNVLYPWTTGQRILINRNNRYNNNNNNNNHPENYFVYNREKYEPSSSSLSLAMKFKDISAIQLQRGRPMFAEIDFVPRKYLKISMKKFVIHQHYKFVYCQSNI